MGDLITLTGQPTNLGLPQYTLNLDGEPAVTLRYDGQIMFQGATGPVVEFVSATASQNEAAVTLRATQPGAVEAMISVSGEIRLDATPGPTTGFAWSSATPSPVILTVAAPAAHQLDLGGTPIQAWAWSPDGKTMALAGDQSVFLVDPTAPQNRVELQVTAVEQVSAIAFSPDGRLLALGLQTGARCIADGGSVQVWDMIDGRPAFCRGWRTARGPLPSARIAPCWPPPMGHRCTYGTWLLVKKCCGCAPDLERWDRRPSVRPAVC